MARQPRVSSLGEGEAVDGLAFAGFVRIEVFSRGVDVAMSHELLDGDNIAAAFKEPRGVGVAELVQCRVRDLEFDFDVVAFDADVITGDISRCRRAEDRSARDVEDGAVPWGKSLLLP